MKPITTFCSLACMLILLASQAQSQDAAAVPSPKLVSTDSLITVLPPRSINEINTGIENAKNMLRRSEAKQKRAEDLLSYTESRIDVKKKEIDLLDSRLDAANEAKRESEAASLKGQKHVAEQLLDILQRQKDLRAAEIDAAAAEHEYASSMQSALEMELELEKQRSEQASVTQAGGIAESSLTQVIGDLISKTLDAQMDLAKNEQKFTDRKRELTNRRMKLHEAQSNFSKGAQ